VRDVKIMCLSVCLSEFFITESGSDLGVIIGSPDRIFVASSNEQLGLGRGFFPALFLTDDGHTLRNVVDIT